MYAQVVNQSPTTVWPILEKYGLPTAMLLFIVWGLYRIGRFAVWPTVEKLLNNYLALLQTQADVAQVRLDKANAEHAATNIKIAGDFTHALEVLSKEIAVGNTILEQQFEKLHARIDRQEQLRDPKR
jgi:hypothetical protein